MKRIIQQIDVLDIALFNAIPSQTDDEDKRSLLAVQRAIATSRGHYAYLEIGSHLGGTIQPHLLDHRCKRIFSIDTRPLQQPDDANPGCVAYYENNSTASMLKLLSAIDSGAVSKLRCFELDASKVDPLQVTVPPQIAFIDGEHTKRAVLSDYQFCNKVISSDGIILFHDFDTIYLAVLEICELLKRKHQYFMPIKLGGSVFAIFFEKDIVWSDPYLTACYAHNKHFLLSFRIKLWLKSVLPSPVWKILKYIRNKMYK